MKTIPSLVLQIGFAQTVAGFTLDSWNSYFLCDKNEDAPSPSVFEMCFLRGSKLLGGANKTIHCNWFRKKQLILLDSVFANPATKIFVTPKVSAKNRFQSFANTQRALKNLCHLKRTCFPAEVKKACLILYKQVPFSRSD